MKRKVFIIAEAGVNHNGDIRKALELVRLAKKCGANAIKFQIFKTDRFVADNAELCKYQSKGNKKEKQKDMLKKLEFSQENFLKIYKYSKKIGIEFMSTAFDCDSLNFLITRIKVKRIKIASGDLVNPILLFKASNSNLPIILSTGMSNISEIKLALGIIGFSYIKKKIPKKKEALEILKNKKTQKILKQKVTILQCTTEYPTQLKNANLQVISTLKKKFGLKVGLSDHTQGINISIASIPLGIALLEKHFTLSKKLNGPDHSSSLEPSEFKMMVNAIRDVEIALGSEIKKPSKEENYNKSKIRGKLFASKQINKNDYFSLDNVIIKRSSKGKNSIDFLKLNGKKSKKNYSINEEIS